MTTRGMLVVLLLAAGCAGPISHMREEPAAVLGTPPPGKAMVVFLRPSSLGFAVASSVYELKVEGDAFVGIVPAKRKLVYLAEPGATRFMVVSEAADFMAAELEAGKIYHALVTPRMGVWKARFSLRPVTAEDVEAGRFSDWDKDCQFIENTPASHAWAREHWADIQAKKVEYLEKWEPRQNKPTLRRTDGR